MNRSNFELSMHYSCNHKRVANQRLPGTGNVAGFAPRPFRKARGQTCGIRLTDMRFLQTESLTLPLSLFEERGAPV